MNLPTTLKLEEIASLGLALLYFHQLPYVWWLFALLFFTPDIAMLGYLAGNKAGAFVYNLFHHKGVAIILILAGIYYNLPGVELSGTVLFAHSSFDRIFGYGLKHTKGFKFTHLGTIGPEKFSQGAR